MILPELPEALIVRRSAHGFSHSFTALQMDKYGRDCAAAAVAAAKQWLLDQNTLASFELSDLIKEALK